VEGLKTRRGDEYEHLTLTWKLIEWKVAYYKPEAIHSSRLGDFEVSDEVYDAAELRYLTLCRKLGKRNTIVHKGWPGFQDLLGPPNTPMMEVDTDRPSVQLVLAKLGSPKVGTRPTKRKRKV
jgi:hypothetical protein